jgi:hypothetical protein
MKFLATQIAKNTKDIRKNQEDIIDIRNQFGLLRKEFEDKFNQVGSALDGIGEVDMDGVLGALEKQIKEKKGLNIGDRWRLRFKDDENKDLFLQDRKKKGYYRFRTTGCDRMVRGIKCNPGCCDGQNDHADRGE